MSLIADQFAELRRGSPYPAAVLAVCYAAGISLNHQLSPGPLPLITGLVLVAFLLPIAIRSNTGWMILAPGFLLAGALSVALTPDRGPEALKSAFETGLLKSGDPVILEGSMPDGFELRPEAVSIDVDLTRIVVQGRSYKTEGTVRLFVPLVGVEAASEFEDLQLLPGSFVSIAARLEREERFSNPGGFRFLEHLDREGIDAVGFVKSPVLIERVGQGRASITGCLSIARNSLVSALISGLPQPAAGIAAASLIGNRHFLTRESAAAYREGGTFHILVVSGLHVTVAGGMCLWLLSGIGVGKAIKFIVPIAAVWGYALVSGAGTPVIRAAVMFTFVASAEVFGRVATPVNALGAAVLFLLAFDPESLFDPSFQLTVLSVAAIAGLVLPLIERLRAIGQWHPTISRPLPPRVPRLLQEACELLYWNERAWQVRKQESVWTCELVKAPIARKGGGTLLQRAVRLIFEGLAVSTGVQIFLLPLQAFYFHRIAPAGIFLNLASGIYLLVFGFAVTIGQICGLISGTLASSIANITSFGTDAWLTIQTSVAALAPSLRIPVYSGAMRTIYLLHFLPLALLVVRLLSWEPFAPAKPRSRRLIVPAALLLACISGLIVFHPRSAPGPDGILSVTFLDVGQGDSIFVRFPDGRTVLIDGGGRRAFERALVPGSAVSDRFDPDALSIGESVVSEFLWEHGYARIDLLLLSHPDADHIGGLADVIRNFRAGALLLSDTGNISEAEESLVGDAFKRGVSVYGVSAGKVMEIGGAKIELLWPAQTGTSCGGSDNDLSIVIRITFGVRKFLFTGDIEKCAEELLSASPDLIRADVVKIPHHGSRTSSTVDFVRRTGAEFAIVSAGRRSQFGHPHKEVVERWNTSGAKVYSTAESGAITVTTDGSRLEVKTHLKQ